MNFRYDDTDHTYWRREDADSEWIRVPGVSEILEAAGIGNFDRIPDREKHLEIGHALHMAIQEFLEGKTPWWTQDPELAGRMEAFELWVDESGFKAKPEDLEQPRYHPIHGYAGTPDAIGTFGPKHTTVIPDWKKGGMYASYPLSLAAYRGLCYDRPPAERVVLRLPKKGGRAIAENLDRDRPTAFFHDFQVFLSALKIWRWKQHARL